MIKNLKEDVTKFIEERNSSLSLTYTDEELDLIEDLYIFIVKKPTSGSEPSDVYIKNKTARLRSLYGKSFVRIVEKETAEDIHKALVYACEDPKCVGFIVQKPMTIPDDELQSIIDKVSKTHPEKDIDNICPYNLGKTISVNSTEDLPLTAKGMIKFLDKLIPLDEKGQIKEPKIATVLGRSVIVGKPTIIALINRGYSVFTANSKTNHYVLKDMLLRSDVIVSAVGKHGVITNNYLKPNAIILDVGINRNSEGKLAGDLRIDDTGSLNFSYTPVPGGIGKITSNEFYIRVIEMVNNHVHKYQKVKTVHGYDIIDKENQITKA